jgi:glycerol-3-phosphate cytidylyltransferase
MANTLSHFCLENPEKIQDIYNIINIKSDQEYLLYHNKTLTSYEILHLFDNEYGNINNILLQYFPDIIFSKNNIQTFIILIHISCNYIGNIIINNEYDIIEYIKDIKFFYPNLVINSYIFTPIDEKYNEAFENIDNLYCRKATTYSHYIDMKSNTKNTTKKFPKLFYIKFKDASNADTVIMNKYEKGITFGTFDLFHFGHDNILKRCRNYCNYLCLGLSSDDLNIKKGKTSIYNYNKRKDMIEGSSEFYVDMVFKEEYLEYKDKYIVENGCDILMMGDDWLEKFDWVSCNVLYMERTPNISTTMLKEQINENKNNK